MAQGKDWEDFVGRQFVWKTVLIIIDRPQGMEEGGKPWKNSHGRRVPRGGTVGGRKEHFCSLEKKYWPCR